MARIVSVGLFLVLITISGLHAYWGGGGFWPASSERELIDTVIGSPDFARMPPAWMTFAVAIALLCTSFVPLSASGLMPFGKERIARLLSGAVAIVFVARGLAGFYPSIRSEQALTEPFATLDISFYSPLCLGIGTGFAIVAVMGRR